MTRFEIINFLIQRNNYHSYLEIGVMYSGGGPGTYGCWCGCFELVNADYKVGIDPERVENSIGDKISTYKLTSDEYFDNHPNHKYDIIFIDGLHEYKQVIKDIYNSLKALNPGGAIVIHDCNPPTEISANTEYVPIEVSSHGWYGNVWKAIVYYRKLGLNIKVVDTDCGCAVLTNVPSWEELEKLPFSHLNNRKEVLNLI